MAHSKFLFLSFILSLYTLFATGQNLVLNPSFELFIEGSPDFTNWQTSYNGHWEPLNKGDQSEAPYDESFSSFALFSGQNGESEYRRFYFLGELATSLEADATYEVSFFVRSTNESTAGMSGLGVALSDAPPVLEPSEQTPGLYVLPSGLAGAASPDLLEKSYDWKELTFSVKAKGGESYLVIGHFLPLNRTKVAAYYDNSLRKRTSENKFTMSQLVFDLVSVVKTEVEETVLGKVYYEVGSYDVMAKYEPILQELNDYLLTNPDKMVVIHGFTDRKGESDDNATLSKNRCLKVRAYLIENGISKDRIQGKFWGEQKAESDTDPSNRRVEFIIRPI